MSAWASVVYDCGMSLAVHSVLAPWQRLRVWRRRAPGTELDQRLGRWSPPAPGGSDRILVHAVSVGEVAAAGALVRAIGELAPDMRVVLSTGNQHGRAAAERLRESCAAIEAVTYLPWDRHGAMTAWMERIGPAGVVVVETEIWPNLFRSAQQLGIPLVIANGRLYPRDVARYRLARRFFARVLQGTAWIGVQNREAHDAFVRIGAEADRLEVVGNLKVDAVGSATEIPAGWLQLLEAVRGPVVVAGSTHHPEERFVLEAVQRLRAEYPDLRLVLAPRHPERASQVRCRVEAARLAASLWSSGPTAEWDVLVVDRIGGLAALYGWADVVVIGGSLVNRGGHNPLEAAAAGRAMVIGPSYEHFRDLVEGLVEAGGIQVLFGVDNPVEALHGSLRALLANAGQRARMGERARRYLQSQQGVAERYARGILDRFGIS